jgi:hypothetical protein
MDKPILFSGPMVRAILEDRKTMTRRVIKPQPDDLSARSIHIEGGWYWRKRIPPRYQVGDRLWVRENWGYHGGGCDNLSGQWEYYWDVSYHADGAKRRIEFQTQEEQDAARLSQNIKHKPSCYIPDGQTICDCIERWWERKKSIPSIYMPRWASRITLEVTGVKVEQLQEITDDDAIAEGVEQVGEQKYGDIWKNIYKSYDPAITCCSATAAFETLWDSINGDTYPWAFNPWVWVYTFKRI